MWRPRMRTLTGSPEMLVFVQTGALRESQTGPQPVLRDRLEVKRMVACPDRGAEREPDDMFRSQTVVSDSREGAG